MKFMKLGTRPDTFYTEDATRSIISDVPSDLTVRVNNVTYLLHKAPLLSKCGLIQRLCSDSSPSSNRSIELHDIPGGEDAFELCAKFCYGITINLSAHNFVSALCAAKFLRMTEPIEKGNLVTKLEAFFTSCILEGWKDSILALHTTRIFPEWSENLGIIRRCIDSIIEKILTPPVKVIWSFTYTRPGYERKRHQSVPKDWWTEDIADLDIDLFRCVIIALRSTNFIAPQLIGEALHVYACRWLLDSRMCRPPESSATQDGESVEKKQIILETLVSLIPSERGSVSVGFLLRLLGAGIVLRVSPITKTELIRRSGLQLEEATANDLLLPGNSSSDHSYYDADTVGAVLESFFRQWRRHYTGGGTESVISVRKVGKLIDSYLQVVARDLNMPVQKMVALAEAVPEIARTDHDELYKAINIYLKEHPNMNKEEKKRLCRILDCQKLSPEVRNHAVRNEHLPLRTVVQFLFVETDPRSRCSEHKHTSQQPTAPHDELSRLGLGSDDQSSRTEGSRRSTMPSSSSEGVNRHGKSDEKLQQRPESSAHGKEGAKPESEIRKEVKERRNTEGKLDPRKISQRRGPERSRSKGGQR